MKGVAIRMQQGAVVDGHMEIGSLVAVSVLYILGELSGHRVCRPIRAVAPHGICMIDCHVPSLYLKKMISSSVT
jgi:hypothetical protein